jgi:hypothetical protein
MGFAFYSLSKKRSEGKIEPEVKEPSKQIYCRKKYAYKTICLDAQNFAESYFVNQ